jgi:hypothetical protein
MMGIASWLGLRPKSNKQPKRRVKTKSDTYPPLPAQDEREFQRFLDLIRAEKVKSYLEIGARHGGSFNAVMRSWGFLGPRRQRSRVAQGRLRSLS